MPMHHVQAPLPASTLECSTAGHTLLSIPFADFACHALDAGAAPGIYSGVLDCFVKTFKADGPLAFYNGFSSNFARLGRSVSCQQLQWLGLQRAKCARVGALCCAAQQPPRKNGRPIVFRSQPPPLLAPLWYMQLEYNYVFGFGASQARHRLSASSV